MATADRVKIALLAVLCLILVAAVSLYVQVERGKRLNDWRLQTATEHIETTHRQIASANAELAKWQVALNDPSLNPHATKLKIAEVEGRLKELRELLPKLEAQRDAARQKIMP